MLRRWWDNPRTALRLTLGVIIAGGVIAGLGTFIRDTTPGGNDQWTFLLDAGGLLIAFAGAALDFRASARLGEPDHWHGTRRAIRQVVVGGIAGAGGCVAVGWVASESLPALARGLMAAAMTAGIGTAFAGLLYIGWFSGGDRLERRIGQRVDEEW